MCLVCVHGLPLAPICETNLRLPLVFHYGVFPRPTSSTETEHVGIAPGLVEEIIPDDFGDESFVLGHFFVQGLP